MNMFEFYAGDINSILTLEPLKIQIKLSSWNKRSRSPGLICVLQELTKLTLHDRISK